MKLRLLALSLLFAPLSALAGLVVSPVHFHEVAGTKADVIHLTNQGDAKGMYQVSLYAWSQKDGRDVLTPTSAIIASPVIFGVEAHKSQVLRFMNLNPNLATSEYFKISIRQLPSSLGLKAIPVGNPNAKAKTELTFLSNYELPIGFEPKDAPAAHLVATVVGGHLRLSNTGGKAFVVNGINAQTGAMGWVLPGGSLDYPRIKVAPGQVLHLKGFEQETATITVQ